MGADGHITIFDYDKIEKQFGIKKTEEFLTVTIPSATYKQEIFGRKIITRYNGDNFFAYWEDKDEWYDSFLSKDEIREMIKWCWDNAYIDKWEVWT